MANHIEVFGSKVVRTINGCDVRVEIGAGNQNSYELLCQTAAVSRGLGYEMGTKACMYMTCDLRPRNINCFQLLVKA